MNSPLNNQLADSVPPTIVLNSQPADSIPPITVFNSQSADSTPPKTAFNSQLADSVPPITALNSQPTTSTIIHQEIDTINETTNCKLNATKDDWDIDLEEEEDVPKEKVMPQVPARFAEFSDVFDPVRAEELPPHRPGFDCEIELLPGTTPPFGPVYSLSPTEDKAAAEYFERNLKKHYIRDSRSTAATPIFFVGNPPDLRLVANYQALDKKTKKFKYPLPLITDLLDCLRSAKIFTKIDLKTAYHQLRVREGDEWLTAVRYKQRLYEYQVMPMGLANAPAYFQRFVDHVFSDMRNVFVVIYLDDFLIYSEDEASHDVHVRAVLQRLRENKLHAKLEKCQFGVSSVKFLGYQVDSSGIACDKDKIKAIVEWPVPKSKQELQVFLGLANYLRKFVNNFARIAAPLFKLLRKDVPYSWIEECQDSFETLKIAISSVPVLIHVNPNEPFWVSTDASDFALSCVLLQKGTDEELHPAAYYSRNLTAPERNYCIYEKELLAIKVAFDVWRHYLEGAPHRITVYSDHKGLETLADHKLVDQRRARWSLTFKRFDFVINYRPGKENGLADALSRRPDYKPSEEELERIRQQPILEPHVVQIAAIQTRSQTFLDRIRDALPHDGFYQSQLSPAGESPFIMIDGIPHFQDRIYVPDGPLRLEVLLTCHESKLAGHLGRTQTLELITRKFYWPHMDKTVREFVSACHTCARSKPARHSPYGLLMPLPVPEGPWVSIGMDFITDLPPSEGMTAILTIVDRFTKMAHFVALPKLPSAEETAMTVIKEVIRLHGLPSEIITDRGTQFTARLWRRLMELLGIKPLLSSAYHPQTNGQTERTNQTLQQYLRCFTTFQQDDWVSLLPLAEFTFNNSVSASTGFTPFFAHTGYHPRFEIFTSEETRVPSVEERLETLKRVHEDLKVNLAKAQAAYENHANKHRKEPPSLKPGDRVWLKAKNIATSRPSKKFDYKYFGPYEIVRSVNDAAFELKLPPTMPIHPVFHVSCLKKATVNQFSDRQHSEPPPIVVNDQEEYEVQEILDSKIIRNRLQYLVDWTGYSPAHREWIDVDNVHSPRLVKKFHEKNSTKPTPQDLEAFLRGGVMSGG